jgi:hypothetical protein
VAQWCLNARDVLTLIRVKHLDSELMRDTVAEQEVSADIPSVHRCFRYFYILTGTAARQIKNYMLATIAQARQNPAKESSGIEVSMVSVRSDTRDSIDERGGMYGGGEEVEGGTGRLLQHQA